MTSPNRRHMFTNPAARSWVAPPPTDEHLLTHFHQQMPGYSITDLVSLDHVAAELGVAAVHLKHESDRFGLPSFKILGASWGTFRAIVGRLGLPLESSLDTVKRELSSHTDPKISLYAATDGNHGRAVARMASILSVPAEIHVPAGLDSSTIRLIESEGARVLKSNGTYDDAIMEAYTAAKKNEGVFIQDCAFDDYEEIPQWIVDGYLTMLREIDQQLHGKHPDLIVAPVGVGSFAQAVVAHSKQEGRSTAVLTVEPDTAACLCNSLRRDELTPEQTTPTIMAGLDCGTPSTIAWPVLRSGVDASITVSDLESHKATLYLHSLGLSAGPCGAAPLAAIRRLTGSDKSLLGLDKDSIIVLLCTEGSREYKVPLSDSILE